MLPLRLRASGRPLWLLFSREKAEEVSAAAIAAMFARAQPTPDLRQAAREKVFLIPIGKPSRETFRTVRVIELAHDQRGSPVADPALAAAHR